MKLKFKRSTEAYKDAPYEVSIDGRVLGTVKKKRDVFTGIQRGGIYTSWVAETPDGLHLGHTGDYFNRTYEATDDFNRRTKFGTRAEAGEGLAKLAGIEVT